MTQSLFWVFVYGIMFFTSYIAFKRALPPTILLFFVLFMNYYFDQLPGYALGFIYLFIILTMLGLIAKLMNLRANV